MAAKSFKGLGKAIMSSQDRPNSLDELLTNEPVTPKSQNTENTKNQKNEISKKRNSVNTKKQKPVVKSERSVRYETRIDPDLDVRFRRYMFEHKAKTNPTLVKALDEFLTKHGC